MATLRLLMRRPRWLLAGVALLAWGSVALALLSQYQFDMQPCPWCTLQRLIYLVIGAVALAAAAWPGAGVRRGLAVLGVLLALSGVASALWQQYVAAASPSCNLTLADRILDGLGLMESLPSVFMPMTSCADAAVNLLGVPYALWSVALFAALGLVNLVVWRRPA